jgi:hypothetical protein
VKTAIKLLVLTFMYASVSTRAQMQTLVVGPTSTNSPVVTVSTNSYAIVKSVVGDGDLAVNLQGYSFTVNGSSASLNNLYVAGPATIQLQAHCCAFYQSFATVEVISPITQSIPSTAVVIPSDAGGPVNIVLESSSDLINWTAALPGTYGSSTTNRFFRVKAVRTQ